MLKKPTLEVIAPEFGSSIEVKHYDEKNQNENASWHFHPEMEIVYVNGGAGKRHIGSHISYYNNGDLIFIGANLPHYGFTNRFSGNKSETVVQVREGLLGTDFMKLPEMEEVQLLFEKAKKGIVFHGETKRHIGAQLESLVPLDSFKRLLRLIKILQYLASSTEYTLLNLEGIMIETEPQDNERLNQIFAFVQQEFKRSIRLNEIAGHVSMTVPAFCRYFKQRTGKTFTKFVNEHRLVHAIKLISEQPLSITEVCYECGFNNFSHFHKSFKTYTGKTPTKYRNELIKIVR
ncbi:helix-turn-helix domain-containing protein [Sungkyunkwania multivorans]|uniref:Helix-turn-helix domain-containing protein n=1 Tax=Sungkyunkwania multivorans TaxID=1173618 RepID=A0ABW3CU65_9FLAO